MIFTDSRHSWGDFLQKWFYFLLAVGIFTNLSSWLITILEPDGALYASIAKNIALTGDFINLTVEGNDWLDKPHFPFWVTAISFKIFGINTFAYKFPALLFWGMGGIYTFRFAQLLYGKSAAQLSVLIYLSATHLVISNNDVRAEPFLTGLIIASVFHFYQATRTNAWFHIFIGSLTSAMALMTKGPFVLIIIGSGLIIDWLLKKEWKEIFHFRWLVAAILILIFTIPELYSLYLQFDLHPEKKVFDRYGVSGIRFFFWDSQFGRFFNNGPIKGKGDPFFYVHTLLWAFLPWSLLLYAAIGWRIKNFKLQVQSKVEFIVPGTVVITFLLFSLSSFQLPHYMNIIFPFFAIMLAQYLISLQNRKIYTTINVIQIAICLLMPVIIALLIYFYRPVNLIWSIVFVLSAVLIVLWLFRTPGKNNFFGYSFLSACFTYLFLHIFFYPSLLKYQSGSEAAFYLNATHTDAQIASYEVSSYSFDFYCKPAVRYLDKNTLDSAIAIKPVIIFTSQKLFDSLTLQKPSIAMIKTFPHFRISQLTGKFINHTTRSDATNNFVLAEIKQANGK